MKVALYARVSSEKQDTDLSLSAQLKALREYASRKGYTVIKEYVDEAESGRTSRRPAFLSLEPYRNRKLEEGDCILLDGGPSYKGYMADIQRMIFIGEPGPEVRRAGTLAVRAQEAVEKMLRPGVTAGDIYRAGFSRVAQGEPNIWHRMGSRKTSGWCGHGEGLNMHEPPYLFEGSKAVIKEGMVISVEVSGVAEDRRLANMPEDAYLITKNGFEKLTTDLGDPDIYVKT